MIKPFSCVVALAIALPVQANRITAVLDAFSKGDTYKNVKIHVESALRKLSPVEQTQALDRFVECTSSEAFHALWKADMNIAEKVNVLISFLQNKKTVETSITQEDTPAEDRALVADVFCRRGTQVVAQESPSFQHLSSLFSGYFTSSQAVIHKLTECSQTVCDIMAHHAQETPLKEWLSLTGFLKKPEVPDEHSVERLFARLIRGTPKSLEEVQKEEALTFNKWQDNMRKLPIKNFFMRFLRFIPVVRDIMQRSIERTKLRICTFEAEHRELADQHAILQRAHRKITEKEKID